MVILLLTNAISCPQDRFSVSKPQTLQPMSKLLGTLAIILFSVAIAFGNNPTTTPGSLVKVDKTEEKVLIEFLRDSDLLTKRPILIFNEDGKEIFKAKARKFEKITEINMANVKEGTYTIMMVFTDEVVDFKFEKKG